MVDAILFFSIYLFLPQADWTFNLGEYALEIEVVEFVNRKPLVVILGNVIVISSSNKLSATRVFFISTFQHISKLSNIIGCDYFTENFQVQENKMKMRNIHPRFFHLLF